jgi:hypothetical protein
MSRSYARCSATDRSAAGAVRSARPPTSARAGVQWSAVPLILKERRRVPALESHVHLQAAVVRGFGSVHEPSKRWMQSQADLWGTRTVRAGAVFSASFRHASARRCGSVGAVRQRARQRPPHHALPAPDVATMPADQALDQVEVGHARRRWSSSQRRRRGGRRLRPGIGPQGGCADERRKSARAGQKDCVLVTHTDDPPGIPRRLMTVPQSRSAGFQQGTDGHRRVWLANMGQLPRGSRVGSRG